MSDFLPGESYLPVCRLEPQAQFLPLPPVLHESLFALCAGSFSLEAPVPEVRVPVVTQAHP